MKDIGSGVITFYSPDGNRQDLKGEIVVRGDRVSVTEIIRFNGQPNGAREINLPLASCVIYWEPEVYEVIGFE
ncbi:hypothetical protein JNUCC42_11895 [Brevibacterium sp. JNUCC-42]|uniref:Uncharacterized protein n=1 Tax=Brevibacillus laterosporus TaxID=1465 RepID=A0A502HTQ6_BRELA|nr:hypothetical protein [Brevibacillus laterosporus]QOS97319.1 hypothetical protein JNUCC42_11895 [Brevibacterium sp. JNUCC-42]QDX92901.1 hypothetical protein EEL30_11640 [Brevibacillus laterosporus]RAP27430.1 hypothetical protein C2W64_00929 [Brevibacillus laterosporus]TPG71256.1 hypothetical protein EEL31_24330 [Brevibacillus laterosporus]TPG78107.1 hypothetical protein EEL32_21800 [Brevibacillus laterosporus]